VRPVLVLSWLVAALASAAGLVAMACSGFRVSLPDDAGAPPPDGAPTARPEADGSARPASRTDGGPPDAVADASPSRAIEVLASGFTNPLEIALADDTVFFTLEFDRTATVRKVTKNAGGSAIVAPYDAASGLNALGNDIVVVGPDVLWANGTASVGRILAAPRAGGPERIVKASIDTPYRLAYFGDALYFVDRALSPSTYALQRLPLDGGAATPLATYQVRVVGIAVDGTGVYWTHGGPLANGRNGVRHRPLDAGSDATTDLHVGSDNGDVGGLTLGPDQVIWADTEGGRVLRVAKSGGVTTVLADGLAAPVRVALVGDQVYFTQHGTSSAANGKVSRVPVAGGTVVDVATSLDHPHGVAVDATHVYWTSYGGGEVARIAK